MSMDDKRKESSLTILFVLVLDPRLQVSVRTFELDHRQRNRRDHKKSEPLSGMDTGGSQDVTHRPIPQHFGTTKNVKKRFSILSVTDVTLFLQRVKTLETKYLPWVRGSL